jgi:threonyl-tRNA synthetase
MQVGRGKNDENRCGGWYFRVSLTQPLWAERESHGVLRLSPSQPKQRKERIMPRITLPDGSVKQFDQPISGLGLATSIGPGLAKAAVAMVVNGEQRDLSTSLEADATVALLTLRDPAGLDVMRHTLTAQVLAQAVKMLYPTAKLAIGPTIEHGFYYDIDFAEPLSSEDLPTLQEKMREILASGHTIERQLRDPQAVIAHFEKTGDSYKIEIINDAVAKGELVDGKVSVYAQLNGAGEEVFLDLCRGPHLPNLGMVPANAFALTNLAGAYWRGDSKNKQITRIYGVAFTDKKELAAHLTMLEEAQRRDHRKLGKELDLFHLQEAAAGQIFWHHKGWRIFIELQQYMREKLEKAGYIEVNTPQLVHSDLYRKSGHWDKFGTGNMFLVDDEAGCDHTHDHSEHVHAMKPMNCPCHVQIFNQGIKSYRDLPLRMAEFGSCMRNEAHGALHGLMRVRAFTQDDAHIFCTTEQILDESVAFCELLGDIYRDLGFTDFFVKFSDRPEQRVGADAVWDAAEDALKKACEAAKIEWILNPGEGAFYGPKLEFVLRDAIGRDWQCGTLQVDFNLPARLGAQYVGEDGGKHDTVMLHRAILGSFERFIGILIENYAGHFPLWLAPVQVVATGVTDDQSDYVQEVIATLQNAGLRAEADLRNEKINYKIREHSHQKVPVILVCGEREKEEKTVTVRRLGRVEQHTLPLAALVEMLSHEVTSKALPPSHEKEAAA